MLNIFKRKQAELFRVSKNLQKSIFSPNLALKALKLFFFNFRIDFDTFFKRKIFRKCLTLEKYEKIHFKFTQISKNYKSQSNNLQKSIFHWKKIAKNVLKVSFFNFRLCKVDKTYNNKIKN